MRFEMQSVGAKLNVFLQRRSVKYGLPFLLVVLGGSFGLKEFAQIRYQFSQKNYVKEEAKKRGVDMKNPGEVTLEKEYDRVKDLDIDNWEQIRGPRPWEETNENV